MITDEDVEVNDLGIPEQNQNAGADATHATTDKNDPETGDGASAKTINIQELMAELEDSIAAETKRYKGCVHVYFLTHLDCRIATCSCLYRRLDVCSSVVFQYPSWLWSRLRSTHGAK